MSLRDKFPKFSTKSIVIAVIMLIVLGSFIGIFSWSRINREYSYGYIVVKKDNDFSNRYGFPGSGTLADPFRIENLTIDNLNSYGIIITKTTKHFVIQNCTIRGRASIYIDSVAAGTCIIRNNTVKVVPESYGIGVSNSNGAIIEFNTVFGENSSSISGITIFSSSNVITRNNICYNLHYGIEVWGFSHYGSILFNNCTNCMFGIFIDARGWYSYPEGFHQGEILSQTINNNTCHSNDFGIYLLSKVSSSIIRFNNCSLNAISGIEIYASSDITVKENYLLNNTQGLSLIETNDLIVTLNIIQFNLNYGINATDSSNLVIYYNNFIENNHQGQILGESQSYDNNPIEDPSKRNLWNIPNETEGNYWSDLIWFPGAIYEIDGGDNCDLYPLEYPK